MASKGRSKALDKEFRELKGFWWLEGCYLRSSHGVLDMAECDHCNCIPKEVYYLRCYKHRLCLECKQYCRGYDCLKCGVSTSPEQLKAAPPYNNYEAIHLLGLCPICEEEMTLRVIEYHIEARHKHDVSFVQPNIQKTKNEDTTMDVDGTGDGKACDHDLGQFSEETGLSWEHSPVFEAAAESSSTSRLSQPIAEISKRPLSKNNVLESELKEHKYECPKIERECFDCGVKVLKENLQDPLDKECQTRVVFCEACHSVVTCIQLGDHDQECLEKPVVCDDCSGEVLWKEKSKHASECPMRLVYCENCARFYAYSTGKEHREQCEKKKLACEYCKLKLKGDDEKNAHLETCEEALIGCAFKEFGCNEKAPRKEMQEHEKDPHNALLNQVILAVSSVSSALVYGAFREPLAKLHPRKGLQERIENLERPLTVLVEKLRNSNSVGTSQ